MDLLAGALVVTAAAFLGGVIGFGYSLVATPLLLLLGFDLPFVVTANLSVACVTRITVAYRFRSDARPRRAAGLVVMGAAFLLWRAVEGPPPRELPGATLAAGFAGGFLGAATSLNGVAPVLLLARDKAAPRSVLADLALYFVASNAIGLGILLIEGGLESDALYPAFLLWLPGSLLGNWAGTLLGPSLPETAFRRLTLAIVFAAGAATVLTA